MPERCCVSQKGIPETERSPRASAILLKIQAILAPSCGRPRALIQSVTAVMAPRSNVLTKRMARDTLATVSGRLTASQDASLRMAVRIRGKTYYRTAEALQRAGISRATYFRWLKTERVPDVAARDRNERRLFSREDVEALAALATRVRVAPTQVALPLERP